MNKYPQLKSFLKDGEAESYQGVTVKYIHGRTAVMTIFNDEGNVQEKILLHTLATKQDMHALMQRKGFVQKKPVSQSQQTERDTLERLKQPSPNGHSTKLLSGAASTTANNLAQHHTDEELLRLVGGDGREMVVFVVGSVVLVGLVLVFVGIKNWSRKRKKTATVLPRPR